MIIEINRGQVVLKMLFSIVRPFYRRLFALSTDIILCLIFFAGCNNIPSNLRTLENPPVTTDSISNGTTGNTIIKLANGEWNPYSGKNLPGNGCDSRVVTEAFAQAGYSIEYDFFPWARAYHVAEIGEWDGTLEWDDTPDHRKGFYISSEPLSEQEWVFFYRSDRPFQWESLKDLEGKVVGITSGYVYSDAFLNLIETGKVSFEEASTDEANFKKLLAGRIDVFPMEKSVGNAILQNSFTPEEKARISFHPKSFHAFHPYLLLSKANQLNGNRIQQFDQSLHNLKNSQKYTDIMKDCQK